MKYLKYILLFIVSICYSQVDYSIFSDNPYSLSYGNTWRTIEEPCGQNGIYTQYGDYTEPRYYDGVYYEYPYRERRKGIILIDDDRKIIININKQYEDRVIIRQYENNVIIDFDDFDWNER